VDAIARRDSARAIQLLDDYHRTVIKRIQSSHTAKELRVADPGLARTLSTWLEANVGVASGLAQVLPS
jgi:hypothetical protein